MRRVAVGFEVVAVDIKVSDKRSLLRPSSTPLDGLYTSMNNHPLQPSRLDVARHHFIVDVGLEVAKFGQPQNMPRANARSVSLNAREHSYHQAVKNTTMDSSGNLVEEVVQSLGCKFRSIDAQHQWTVDLSADGSDA